MLVSASRYIGLFLLFSIFSIQPSIAADKDKLFDEAIRAKHRDKANMERDVFRHPRQTLNFFGLLPHMNVVEIWPGRGWYTEILAPIMRDEGKLYLAGFASSAKRAPEWRKKMQKEYEAKLAESPEVYDRTIITELSIPEATEIAPEQSVDMILTFRNVHNWMKGEYAEEMFQVFAKTLKPGGVLGIVEHRAIPGTSLEEMIQSGYVTEEHVIKLAEDAGFVLEARTDINANGNDTTQHPKGVWTLPPTLRFCKSIENDTEKDQCIDKYTKIGESDRMTLKFRKL